MLTISCHNSMVSFMPNDKNFPPLTQKFLQPSPQLLNVTQHSSLESQRKRKNLTAICLESEKNQML